MNFKNLTEYQIDDLILKKISTSDHSFIQKMFADSEIKKYYVVSKKTQLDYSNFIKDWLNDMTVEAGFCWVIIKKGKGLFSFNKPCGFIAFEFKDVSRKKVSISYAVNSKFRKQGIAYKSISLILNELQKLGVESIEADIDITNLSSEKLVEKLGFRQTRIGLIDKEMSNAGDFRFRYLWVKEIFDYSILKFHVINWNNFYELMNSETTVKIWEAFDETDDETDFNSLSPQYSEKYHFMIQTYITEKMVGISDDNNSLYYTSWELLREEEYKNHKFVVLCGWENQFNYHEIGIEKHILEKYIQWLIAYDPIYFSASTMKYVIGLEGFKLEE